MSKNIVPDVLRSVNRDIPARYNDCRRVIRIFPSRHSFPKAILFVSESNIVTCFTPDDTNLFRDSFGGFWMVSGNHDYLDTSSLTYLNSSRNLWSWWINECHHTNVAQFFLHALAWGFRITFLCKSYLFLECLVWFTNWKVHVLCIKTVVFWVSSRVKTFLRKTKHTHTTSREIELQLVNLFDMFCSQRYLFSVNQDGSTSLCHALWCPL
mmetsp:Transcript_43170/g.69218  ORF Transcript_43170/g.69218 Transcript_43170/m.69218 type:complete len:210 (+) Transcript_43170:2046-2675(+)